MNLVTSFNHMINFRSNFMSGLNEHITGKIRYYRTFWSHLRLVLLDNAECHNSDSYHDSYLGFGFGLTN